MFFFVSITIFLDETTALDGLRLNDVILLYFVVYRGLFSCFHDTVDVVVVQDKVFFGQG
jgi:hypothetical protein